MKFKKHVLDLIKVKVLSYLGHKPQLFRATDTRIKAGQVYDNYGWLLKAVPLTDEDREEIQKLRDNPEDAAIETPKGFAVYAPDPRCAICPLFLEGIPCRMESFDCMEVKYEIIKKPSHHGY